MTHTGLRYITLVGVLAWLNVTSQDNEKQSRHLRVLQISYSAEASRSFLTYSEKNVNNRFPVPEFRLGTTLQKELSRSFYLKAGIHAGVKLKSKQYYNPAVINPQIRYWYALSDIDHSMSLRDHYFIEAPFLLMLGSETWKFGSGVSGRVYLPNSRPGQDFIAASPELGSLTTLTYSVNRKFTVGLQYYMAVTSIFNGFTYVIDGVKQPEFKARNNFFGLSAEYRIK